MGWVFGPAQGALSGLLLWLYSYMAIELKYRNTPIDSYRCIAYQPLKALINLRTHSINELVSS